MFDLISVACIVMYLIFLRLYLNALSEISRIDDRQKKVIGIFYTREITNLDLLRDHGFFFTILKGSYKKLDLDDGVIRSLNSARLYLFLQFFCLWMAFFSAGR